MWSYLPAFSVPYLSFILLCSVYHLTDQVCPIEWKLLESGPVTLLVDNVL